MGKLVQIDTYTVSSPEASVILGGGSSGSSGLNASINTDDVYMLTINNCISTAVANGQLRVTKSGTPDTSANYDWATLGLRTDTTYTIIDNSNQTLWTYIGGWSTAPTTTEAGVSGNAIVYLHNFNSDTEYSFVTNETVSKFSSGVLGPQGGAVHTVASASDGVEFSWSAGNIGVGSIFTLYKVL